MQNTKEERTKFLKHLQNVNCPKWYATQSPQRKPFQLAGLHRALLGWGSALGAKGKGGAEASALLASP